MSGTQSTEDRILGQMEFEDDSTHVEDSSDTDTSTEGQGASTDTSPTPVDTDGGTGSTTDTPAPQQQTSTRRDGLVEQPNARDPRQRDLVDPITGQIVAHGGIERRVFEVAQRTQRDMQRVQTELQQARTQLQAFQQVTNAGQQYGLAPEQQATAMRLMADFQRDPVRTLEALVAEVRAQGHNLPFLENASGVDMQALQRFVDAKLSPFTEQQRQAQLAEQSQTQARQELDGFLGTYPDARSNLDLIAEVMRGENLSLHDAFIKVIQWSAEHGFDYRQPLRAQVAARQTQPGPVPQMQPPQPQAVQQPQRPLPNGRTASASAAPVNAQRSYDENSSWEDMIRSSMHEAGLAP